MTEDQRPEAAKRYDDEWEELQSYVYEWSTRLTGGDSAEPEARRWLDATLYRHREQAYAEGVLDTQRAAPSWWDRNWASVVGIVLGLITGSLVVISLGNGWS